LNFNSFLLTGGCSAYLPLFENLAVASVRVWPMTLQLISPQAKDPAPKGNDPWVVSFAYPEISFFL